MWVATQDLPRSAAHPFYTRLNQLLDDHDLDGYAEGLCQRFYAGDGRPGLAPGRYFRCAARVSWLGAAGGPVGPCDDLDRKSVV